MTEVEQRLSAGQIETTWEYPATSLQPGALTYLALLMVRQVQQPTCLA